MARKKYSEAERQLMETMGANLKRILKDKKLTQLEFSERSDIPNSTVSDYVVGRTLMSPGTLDHISEILHVPKSALTKPINNKNNNAAYYPTYEAIVELPIVGKISCGNGVIAFEEIEGFEPTPKNWTNGGEYFYLRAKGDSMIDARIHDGDLLFIRKQEEVENGEIAAVYIDGEARLKKVIIEDGSISLYSENPDKKKYPTLVLTKGDVRILGKLKKVVIDY